MAAVKAAVCIAAVTVVSLVHVVAATDYIVGSPTGGWQGKTDYKSWASAQTFLPGDTLIPANVLLRQNCAAFKYNTNHNVLEVTAGDYEACSTANPVIIDNSGTTTIALTAPGKRYFICGGPGHCQNGMKLEVEVADRPAPTAPSSPPQLPPAPTPPSPVPRTGSPAPAPAAEPPRHAGHKRHKKRHSPPPAAPTVDPAEAYFPLATVAPMSSPAASLPMSSDSAAALHAQWGYAALGLVALWFAVLAI
ncbi:Blue copper protein [Triticum urartu]|uniref:Blue copper protein n=1 Tax=Triticum urartu TaxID=4572 RepID=M7ZS97_TRIUA|nr:Blue copper protein [Triticum urartu]